MIRFRFREDEKRYLLLLGEIYRMMAATLSPAEMSMALRNFGKLQDMLMLEGVRQGVGAAAISNLAKSVGDGDLEHLKAFQLHAHIYGSMDTPLSRVEAEWVEKLGFGGAAFEQALGAWLDPEAMRFAPDTESAALAAAREFRELLQEDESPPDLSHLRQFEQVLARPVAQRAGRAPDDLDRKEIGQEVAPWPEPERQPEPSLLRDSDDVVQEHPALLDRTRDALIELKKQGFTPKDWAEMLMKLHLAMQVDAGFLDLQLSTPMGMTVLAQAGYTDLHPGAQLDLMSLQSRIASAALSGPEPRAEGDEAGSSDGEGTDPSEIAP